ncbi:MAG: ABC transporter ATP-binding protein [Phycisphaerales bacterium]|nr:ABC transporter ATP-binding protein [Phycisphaerales bacterium]
MSIITLDNMTRCYGSNVAVNSLSLDVPEGSLFGFLGPNGGGKTTTIRVLLGLLRATSGAASIFGLNVWKHSPRIKADVGYLPGDLRLYPWLTGHQAIRMVAGIRGMTLEKPGRSLAERYALDLSIPVRRMSRGMRQKLGIILALAHDPKLVILDEPTSGLDPLMQAALITHLRSLAMEGRTVFFSSHSLSEVEQLCHHVAILRRGTLVACEALSDLRTRAAREVMLTWKPGVSPPADAPPFLRVHTREDRTWRCSMMGSAVELVRWAGAQDLEDLSIGEPDLEVLFRRYYDEGETP